MTKYGFDFEVSNQFWFDPLEVLYNTSTLISNLQTFFIHESLRHYLNRKETLAAQNDHANIKIVFN